jgi:hypothetical protein
MQGIFGHISSEMKSHLSDKRVPKHMLWLESHFLVFVTVYWNSKKWLHLPVPMCLSIKNITLLQPRRGILWLFQTSISNNAHTVLQPVQVKTQFKKTYALTLEFKPTGMGTILKITTWQATLKNLTAGLEWKKWKKSYQWIGQRESAPGLIAKIVLNCHFTCELLLEVCVLQIITPSCYSKPSVPSSRTTACCALLGKYECFWCKVCKSVLNFNSQE